MLSEASASRALTLKHFLIAAIASLIYLLLCYWLIGFSGDRFILVSLFFTFYLGSFITRKFILAFLIFILYWVIFDFMKAFPNYLTGTVHIQDLYEFEKKMFGIEWNGSTLTPYEYFSINHYTFLDIISGLFYLCWIPVPLGFAAYLYFTRKNEFLRFGLTFVVTNLLGFIIYYSYPAAPPWYVMEFGFDFIPNTPAHIGGLMRFDEYFGVTVFQSIYAKSSNVFAAMPSLHSAYPLLVFYYSLRNKLRWGSIIFGIVSMGIWFTAVYTGHHYISDVVVGICCAIGGISLFNVLAEKTRLKSWLSRYLKVIS